VLLINDDDSEVQVELNLAALARGRFTYQRTGSNVLVRFRVEGQDRKISAETFRFVSERDHEPSPARAVAPGEPAQAKKELKAEARAEPPADPRESQAEARGAREEPQEPRVPIAFAATAIHELQPVVPQGIRARIREQIIVPVTVRISASGTVLSAAPQGDGDTIHRYLASRAAEAARWWRFEPARSRSGTAVPSTKTLHFVFRP
jgi:hypothetical protein